MTSVRPEGDGPSRSEEDRRLLIRYHRHGDQAARERQQALDQLLAGGLVSMSVITDQQAAVFVRARRPALVERAHEGAPTVSG